MAADYAPLVIAYRNGSPVRLSDVAKVYDGVEDVHNMGLFNGKDAMVVIVSRAARRQHHPDCGPVKSALPALEAALPADIDMQLALDRT